MKSFIFKENEFHYICFKWTRLKKDFFYFTETKL